MVGVHRGRIVGNGSEAVPDQNILYVCMHELLKQSYSKNDNEAGLNTSFSNLCAFYSTMKQKKKFPIMLSHGIKEKYIIT